MGLQTGKDEYVTLIFLGPRYRANVRIRTTQLVQLNRSVDRAFSSGATYSDRRVRHDLLVHQIWVTDELKQIWADRARVFSHGYRACMAATQ
jgi:hypothetical protein